MGKGKANTKGKRTVTELIVLGNPNDCGSCERAEEYLRKNKSAVKEMGIDRVTILDPDKSTRGQNLSDEVLGVGNKAQPIFVIKHGDRKETIPGFPKDDRRVPLFGKALKLCVKRVTKRGLFGRKSD